MSSKIKSINDCASGRDLYEYAQANGWQITKNGSYFELEKDGVTVRFPDSARCLPKETRSVISAALVKAGLLVAAVAAVVAWVL